MKNIIFGFIVSLILVSCVPQADYDALQDKYDLLKAYSVKDEAEIADLQTRLEASTRELNALKAEKSSLESQVTVLNTTLATKQAQIVSLEADIADLQSQLDGSSQQAQIDTLNAEVVRLNTAITEKESQISILTQEVSVLKSTIAAKDAEIARLNSIIAEKEAEFVSLEKEAFVASWHASNKGFSSMDWASGSYYSWNNRKITFVDDVYSLLIEGGAPTVVNTSDIAEVSSFKLPFNYLKYEGMYYYRETGWTHSATNEGLIVRYSPEFLNDGGETLKFNELSVENVSYSTDSSLDITDDYVLESLTIQAESINDEATLCYFAVLTSDGQVEYKYDYVGLLGSETGVLTEEKYNDLVKHFR